jgi:hypothetical protein
MALIDPLPPDADPEVRELAKFFNETLGFCPNSAHRAAVTPARRRRQVANEQTEETPTSARCDEP